MKITLTKIAKFTTKKDGSPLLTKAGKPYISLRFQCNEYGEKWVSGFENAETKDWKEGDTVDADIEQKGEYLNFSVKKAAPAGLAEAERYQIKQASESAYACNIAVQSLIRRLEEAGVIKPLYAPYPERDESNTPIF